MIIARTSSGRAIAWVVGVTVLAACNLEVNVHLDGSEDERKPTVILLPLEGDAPVSDALWRPWEYEGPAPLLPRLKREPDLRAAPTFTPFTKAPSIVNRSEVVRAMEDAYPPLLRDAGIGGTARIYFFIEDDGTVGRTVVDESSGHPALDQAAMAVADVYRFTPALNREEPVPVWVSFPITFQVR
jgi:TonB family protein